MDTTAQNSSGTSQTKSDGLAIDFSALADSAKAKLGEIGEPVKDKALEIASQHKDAGAEQLQVAARAIHGAARELESAMPQFAGYVHEVGKRLDDIASDIRGDSLDGLMSRLGEFGRNQPVLIFGGALVAGFALSRFLKSSAQNEVSKGTLNSGLPESMGDFRGMQTGPRTMQSGTVSGANDQNNVVQGSLGATSGTPGWSGRGQT